MKHIVIIGGGPAGIAFAQSAASNASSSEVTITVLEKSEYFFHTYASIRGMIETSLIPKLFIPYDDALTGYSHAEIKRAIVKDVVYTSKTVTYIDPSSSSQSISYDYLIIATGSSYPSPMKPMSDDRHSIEQSILETATNIKKAGKILVIGGGVVGIEMAGELKANYPLKKITIIDGNSELMHNQNVPKIRKPLKLALEKLGVEVLLNQRLTERFANHQFGTKTLTTKSGMSIESDAQLVCAGMTPNIDLMTDSNCLDESGRFIKVKDTMEVDQEGYENIFVLGDASNHPTPKMGYWAAEQGKHLGKNLAVHIRTGKAVMPYIEPSTEAILVPLGPSVGVSQLPLCGGIIVGDFMTSMIKGKDLFVTQAWKGMNAKVTK